jgi:hypothetical protein
MPLFCPYPYLISRPSALLLILILSMPRLYFYLSSVHASAAIATYKAQALPADGVPVLLESIICDGWSLYLVFYYAMVDERSLFFRIGAFLLVDY